MTSTPVVVIGVGNPYRRDDGVGPAVVGRLSDRRLAGTTLVTSQGETTELLEMWQDAELAIVVDAVVASPPHPGRIHRLALGRIGSERAAGSHGMHLGEAVELARQLGRLPKRMVLFAVEVADVRPGVGLSAEVAAGAERLAEEIAVVVWAANRARPATVT